MNILLSTKRVSSFEAVLAAYGHAGFAFSCAIDGGAGYGDTAKTIIKQMPGATVHAFEPFPGNHRFFDGIDQRIRLVKKALHHTNGTVALRVAGTVPADSEWGRRGMVGYSSAGRIVDTPDANDITVECVRTDDVIDGPVDFVKLDLQGAELSALKGMGRLLPDVPLMWIEYSGQAGLLDYIIDNDFMVFDTEYFFAGSPSEEARRMFHVSRENYRLSTDKLAWFGFKARPWDDYRTEFATLRKTMSLVQTDLVCVNRARLDDFLKAARFL